jgi:hypothetical protein
MHPVIVQQLAADHIRERTEAVARARELSLIP